MQRVYDMHGDQAPSPKTDPQKERVRKPAQSAIARQMSRQGSGCGCAVHTHVF